MKILFIIMLIFSYLNIIKIKILYRLLSTLLHFKFIIYILHFKSVNYLMNEF